MSFNHRLGKILTIILSSELDTQGVPDDEEVDMDQMVEGQATPAGVTAVVVRRRKVPAAAEVVGSPRQKPSLADKKRTQPLNLFIRQLRMLEEISVGLHFHGVEKRSSVSGFLRRFLDLHGDELQQLHSRYARGS
jgi:hypothetical protein